MSFAAKCSVLCSIKAWNEMGGAEIVLPPDINKLFQENSYEEAIATLVDRSNKGELLYLADKPKKLAQTMFIQARKRIT